MNVKLDSWDLNLIKLNVAYYKIGPKSHACVVLTVAALVHFII